MENGEVSFKAVFFSDQSSFLPISVSFFSATTNAPDKPISTFAIRDVPARLRRLSHLEVGAWWEDRVAQALSFLFRKAGIVLTKASSAPSKVYEPA